MTHLFFSSSLVQRRGLGLWFDSCFRIVSVLKSKIGDDDEGDSGDAGDMLSLVLRFKGAECAGSSLRCLSSSNKQNKSSISFQFKAEI